MAPGRLAIEDVPVPALASGEALVAIGACGLCATDVKTYKRGHPRIAPGAVLGHEMAGTIVALGGTTEGDGGPGTKWRVGDRVTIPPYFPCGVCDACASGRPTLCPRLMDVRPEPGGFAEMARVPGPIVEHGLVRLPDHVEFAVGALVEPLACAVHGFDALDLRPGDPFVVLGDGPMGQLHVELGRLHGASPVILVGATDARLDFARARADIVLDARVDDVIDRVRRATGAGAAGVAVCVGSPASVATGLVLAKPGGAVNVFAGMPAGDPAPVDLSRVHYEEVRLLGTFGSGPADFSLAAGLISDGRVELSPFITTRTTLDRAIDAFEAAAGYEGIKTVVVFDQRSSRAPSSASPVPPAH
jgi:L-iditol 2-dehydrogenase